MRVFRWSKGRTMVGSREEENYRRIFWTRRNDALRQTAVTETEDGERRCRTIRTAKVARGVCQVKLSRAGRKIGRLKAAAPHLPRQPLNLWRCDNVDAAFCMLDCQAATSIPVLSSYTRCPLHRCPLLTSSPQASIHRFHPRAPSSGLLVLVVLLPIPPYYYDALLRCAATTLWRQRQRRVSHAIYLLSCLDCHLTPSNPRLTPISSFRRPPQAMEVSSITANSGPHEYVLTPKIEVSSSSQNFDLLEACNRLSKRENRSLFRVDVDHMTERTEKYVNLVRRVEYTDGSAGFDWLWITRRSLTRLI